MSSKQKFWKKRGIQLGFFSLLWVSFSWGIAYLLFGSFIYCVFCVASTFWGQRGKWWGWGLRVRQGKVKVFWKHRLHLNSFQGWALGKPGFTAVTSLHYGQSPLKASALGRGTPGWPAQSTCLTLGDAVKVSATQPFEAAPPGPWPADQSVPQGVLKEAFSPVSLTDAERQPDNPPIYPWQAIGTLCLGWTSDLSVGLIDDLKPAVLTESQRDTVASLFEHDKGMNCAHVYSLVSKAASRLMFKSTETLQRTNGLVENRSNGHHHGLLPSRQTLFFTAQVHSFKRLRKCR